MSAHESALAAGWMLPVPQPDDDTIERAARVLAEHMWSASDDELCSCGWTPDDYWQYDDGRRFVADALSNAEEGDEPDAWAPIVQAFTEHQATALLASPAREPGRSEAEIKAEALREFADWWGAGQWAEDFMAYDVEDDESAVRAMCKALTDRAARVADTTTTEAGGDRG